MKPHWIVVSMIFLLVMTMPGCKKNKDYRDPYVGDYYFKVNEHNVNIGDSTVVDTIVYYSGYITKGEYPQEVIIKYLPDESLTFTLYENGEIRVVSTALGAGASGNFTTTDKVSFHFWIMSGTEWVVEGNK